MLPAGREPASRWAGWFCREAEEGRLPEVRTRDDLWPLLATDQLRREGREKRGGTRKSSADPAQLAGRQTEPAFVAEVAEVAEECDRLLASLDDETLKAIAVWKTEGSTNEEIAATLTVRAPPAGSFPNFTSTHDLAPAYGM